MNVAAQTLTGVLSEVTELFGSEAAVLLARHFGGTHLYIGPRPRAGNKFDSVFGAELAAKLRRHFTVDFKRGVEIDVPCGPFTRAYNLVEQIAALDALGLSASQIARALGLNVRTVFKHRRARRLRATVTLSKRQLTP